jgi:hypothetical protein
MVIGRQANPDKVTIEINCYHDYILCLIHYQHYQDRERYITAENSSKRAYM